MPDSPQVAVFVLLVLPGLIALGLYQTLAPVKERETSTQVVLAIVLSLVSYIGIALLHLRFNWIPDPAVLLDASSDKLRSVFAIKPLLAVAVASALSAVIAIAMSIQTSNEFFHKCCRRLRITKRLGYGTHWDSVVHTKVKASWVTVTFGNGETYVGWVETHSDSSDERSLLLSGVSQLSPEPKVEWEKNECLYIPDVSVVPFIRFKVDERKKKNAKGKQSDPSAEKPPDTGVQEIQHG